MFFGLYPDKYIGGNPNILNRGGLYTPRCYYGAHPSSISTGGTNYFGGSAAVQNAGGYPINPVQNVQQDGFVLQTNVQQIQNLQTILDSAKNEQGVVGKLLDNLKGATGLGLSSKKCQSYIDDVKSGKMTYEEAYGKVSKYGSKQTSSVNLLTGLATGAASVLALKSGKCGINAVIAAAGLGAATKAGLKTLDRGTNNIENDALDPKQIAKDGLSGALAGGISAVTAGMGAKAMSGACSATEALKQGAITGAKSGAIAGGVMGAGDYTLECTFEDDTKFDGGEFIINTAQGAATGGIIGAIAGSLGAHKNYSKNNPTGANNPNNPNNSGNQPNSQSGAQTTTTPPASQGGAQPATQTNPQGGSTPAPTGAQTGAQGGGASAPKGGSTSTSTGGTSANNNPTGSTGGSTSAPASVSTPAQGNGAQAPTGGATSTPANGGASAPKGGSTPAPTGGTTASNNPTGSTGGSTSAPADVSTPAQGGGDVPKNIIESGAKTPQLRAGADVAPVKTAEPKADTGIEPVKKGAGADSTAGSAAANNGADINPVKIPESGASTGMEPVKTPETSTETGGKPAKKPEGKTKTPHGTGEPSGSVDLGPNGKNIQQNVAGIFNESHNTPADPNARANARNLTGAIAEQNNPTVTDPNGKQLNQRTASLFGGKNETVIPDDNSENIRTNLLGLFAKK